MADTQPVENLGFEEAMQELDSIVKRLESGKAPLEDSIADYERGIKLKRHCEDKLKAAQLKIDKLTLAPDGSTRIEPFDSQ